MLDTKSMRYVCVNCGSTRIRSPTGGYSRIESNNQGVYCESCQKKNPEVYDKKKGVNVSV